MGGVFLFSDLFDGELGAKSLNSRLGSNEEEEEGPH
jgi:hypothetical protein